MKTKLLSLLLFLAMSVGYSQVTSLAIVGDGVGGWPVEGTPDPVNNVMSTVDGITYTLSDFTVTNGSAKFRANNSWELQWGSTTFPTGTAPHTNNDANIPVIAGTYNISLNIETGEYSFSGGAPIPVVHLVGTAVNGPAEGLLLSTADASIYTANNVSLMNGTVIFDVTGTVFGGTAFPSGNIDETGTPINVTEGIYNITLDLANGTYSFIVPPAPNSIAIVGAGTSAGWPAGTENEVDPLVLTTTDNANYTINGITLTDGPVKFRANNAWTLSWGGVTFPTGPDTTQAGENINAVAGTYNVTLNRFTGVYTFSDALATTNFISNSFKAYPNPTNSNWNFTSAKESIESIQIVNVLGKVVLSAAPKNTVAAIDASGLTTGVYFAKIATATGTTTVKLVKN